MCLPRYRRAAEQLKLQPVHQLQDRDAAVRIHYCRWFRDVWPPRSPDLTSPAFFPWAFLKEGVCSHNLQCNTEQSFAGTDD